MTIGKLKLFISCVLVFVLSLSMDTSSANAQLQRPTRPEQFKSVEDVKNYIDELRKHIKSITGPSRFGKRMVPMTTVEADGEQQELGGQPERPQILHQRGIDAESFGFLQSLQPMPNLKQTRLLPPLPLLAKYLHSQYNHLNNEYGTLPLFKPRAHQPFSDFDDVTDD